MPSPVHVQKAQQRYQMVPVLDENGEQVKTPVKDKKTGEQKVDKRGNKVFMKVTVADKNQPLPMPECDYGKCEVNESKVIEVGTPYKHLTVKTGPYSSRVYTRHEQCPSWNVWEYNFSTSSMVAQANSSMHDSIATLDDPEDWDAVKEEMEGLAQELLDEKQGALDGMPEGLAEGSELSEQVEALESWVTEISDAEKPDLPEADPVSKWFVNGPDAQSLNEEGYDEEDDATRALEQHLEENPDEDEDDWDIEEEEQDAEEGAELSDEQKEAWAEEAQGVLSDAANACEL